MAAFPKVWSEARIIGNKEVNVCRYVSCGSSRLTSELSRRSREEVKTDGGSKQRQIRPTPLIFHMPPMNSPPRPRSSGTPSLRKRPNLRDRHGWIDTRRNFLSCGAIGQNNKMCHGLTLTARTTTVESLIKYFGCCWRSQVLMWGDSPLLVEENWSLERSSVWKWKRNQSTELLVQWEQEQNGVFFNQVKDGWSWRGLFF